MCLCFHIFPNLCNHILVNSVIWLLTERQIQRERGLKYIELLKGLPAVHHCHLTHVECEVPSQQPLGGHLLPRTHKHGYTHTHTHMHAQSDTPDFYIQRRKELFIVAESDDNGTHMYSGDHLPSLTDSPETGTLRFGLVKMNMHVFLFYLLFFPHIPAAERAGLTKTSTSSPR